MIQINSFMVLNIGNDYKISYTYDELDASGKKISVNNKKNMNVADSDLLTHINAIEKYIVN